jgi:hypothetical protein
MLGYICNSAEKLKDGSVEETAADEDNAETHSRNVGVMLVWILVFFLLFSLLGL